MDNATAKPIRFLTLETVMERFGRASRVTIYADIRKGLLPQPVKVGGRTMFVESEIDECARRIVEAPRVAIKAQQLEAA